MRSRLRAAARRNLMPLLLSVGLVVAGGWGLAATDAESIAGRWPDSAEVTRYIIFLAGLVLASLVADAAARVDRAYALAGVVGPWRLPFATGLRQFAIAVAGLVLAQAAVAWEVTRLPAGGSPWWWLLPSALGWLCACWAIGVWIGGLFESRPRAAAVAAFFTAFVGVLLSALANSRPVPRLVLNWDPNDVLNYEWDGGFVASRIDPGVAVWGIATAAAFAVAVIVVTGRRTGTWVRASVPVAVLAVMGLLAPVLGSGGDAVVRRLPDPATLVCTHEHRGALLCGWPEDTALIGEADAKWERIIDLQEEVGLPVPQGDIFINGSRPEGMAGTDLNIGFASTQSIASGMARISTEQLANRCPDRLGYWERAELVEEWLAHQILDGAAGYRIGWQSPELEEEFKAALAAPPEEAKAWARGIVDQIRTCAPAEEGR
ncbi:hypothetical protein [Corynebacterium sp.]|uniref:hypothetical protein n=1 Tax=Corynebacterium sp. TaxID=1720 RepID=UPI0026DCFB48|nr:hypothetical protein [Corynebacterium sp.]MDO4609206.1 hypothetical protein [Corynebacterium sp.]